MSQPPAWISGQSYTTYATAHAAAPFPPASLDSDFANLALTIAAIRANLLIMQRDDGDLTDGFVTPNSLATATLNLIGGWTPRGPWLPALAYNVRDMVTVSSTSYVCATAHTSSAFASDLALGYWQPINGLGLLPSPASTILFTATDRILGRASAGAGTGEEITCTSFIRSLLDDPDAATARTTLGVASGSNPTFGAVTAASLTLSGLNANAFVYSGTAGLIGSTAAPTNGQLLIGSTGVVPVAATLTGTANQVTVTNGAGSITLALPQSIDINATPSFATVNLTNLSTGSVAFIGASSAIAQRNNKFFWDDTNWRLGIGTGAPSYNLHIDGGAGAAVIGLVKSAKYALLSSSGGVLDISCKNVSGEILVAEISDSQIAFGNNAFISMSATGVGSWDVELQREAAGVIGIRQATNPMALRVYNTWTTTTNFERGVFRWNTNVLEVGTEKGSGGGTARALALVTDLTQRWTIGATTGHLLAATDNTYDIGASAATRPKDLYLGGKIKNYNSLPTAGLGVVMVGAQARATAQVAANASVATYALPAADGTYEVSANVLVTTATNHNFTVTCAYTDEGNTARTLTLSFTLVAGGTLVTAVANANGTVPYMGIPQVIRCKASTSITIATTGTFTTVAYNVDGTIKQVG